MFPGFDGGGEWGGASFDPETGYLYVNANQMAWVLQLKDAAKPEKSQAMSFGQRVYQKNCVTCHREDRKGNVPSGYPSLVDIERRRDRAYIETIIRGGKGMMPGFPQLSASEKTAVVDFLLGTEKMESGSGSDVEASHVPYEFVGYDKFLDKNGYPAITPPWGTLTAINLNTGEHVWQRTLGEFRELTKKGIPVTGTENYGGGIVTKGGLFFIAATRDSTFRAFDKRTGKLLWETILPTSSFATPSTYEVDGVQYIALAVGGTKLGMKKGDSYIAFRLPKKH
jgi:quinoprotein glucose dehydrogenase